MKCWSSSFVIEAKLEQGCGGDTKEMRTGVEGFGCLGFWSNVPVWFFKEQLLVFSKIKVALEPGKGMIAAKRSGGCGEVALGSSKGVVAIDLTCGYRESNNSEENY